MELWNIRVYEVWSHIDRLSPWYLKNVLSLLTTDLKKVCNEHSKQLSYCNRLQNCEHYETKCLHIQQYTAHQGGTQRQALVNTLKICSFHIIKSSSQLTQILPAYYSLCLHTKCNNTAFKITINVLIKGSFKKQMQIFHRQSVSSSLTALSATHQYSNSLHSLPYTLWPLHCGQNYIHW
jgi:hypothetical protein